VSVVPAPWAGFGSVGYGFARIYQTLRLVDLVAAEARDARGVAQSPQQSLTFAQQVAAAVQRHAPTPERPGEREAAPPIAAVKTIHVVGHSLGAALATLYVADNAATSAMNTPIICTFASPRVGDPVFAEKFNQLGVTSWRIVNDLDVVPKLPVLGFEHVNTLHLYNSGSSVTWLLECWHSLATYLHLIDAKQPLEPGCVWPPKIAASASLRAPIQPAEAVGTLAKTAEKVALSVPPGGRCDHQHHDQNRTDRVNSLRRPFGRSSTAD
jgi:Lipase (class 3)